MHKTGRSLIVGSWCEHLVKMASVDSLAGSDQTGVGPIENLLREATTATDRAVDAIRTAETAKHQLRNDINSLTTSFDSTIQKSLALIDRLDESVYSGRIDNAQKRAKMEKEANAIVQQAYSNPTENADLRLFERTVDVLRDSAVGLHREYFAYDETVDAKDVLAQVIEYKYRTNALERNLKNRQQKTRSLYTLHEILDEVSETLSEFLATENGIKTQAASIIESVDRMKRKLAAGAYGPVLSDKPSEKKNPPKTRRSIVESTTSGYTL